MCIDLTLIGLKIVMENEEKTLFVWRAKFLERRPDTLSLKDKCVCCKTALKHTNIRQLHQDNDLYKCPLCGWFFSHEWYSVDWTEGENSYSLSVLKQFNINSSELALSELGTYLKKMFLIFIA